MAKNEVKIPKTLEEAQSFLLENTKTISELEEQVTALNDQIKEKDIQLEDLRTLNHKYFLELAQGQTEDETEEKEEEPQSLEDFAKTLKGVIK